jgi:hypothetical protein
MVEQDMLQEQIEPLIDSQLKVMFNGIMSRKEVM